MRSTNKNSLNRVPAFRYDAASHQSSEVFPNTSKPETKRSSMRATMEVNGPGSIHRANPASSFRPAVSKSDSSPVKPIEISDKLDISNAAEMLNQLNQSGNLQSERLAQIKSAIEAGVYETPEKLEAALSKLLSEINGETP